MEIETQETLKLLSLVPIDVQEKKFQTLMLIYEKAMIQAKEELEGFKASLGIADKHIAMIGENSYKWLTVYLTVLKSTGVFVPIQDNDMKKIF